MLPVGPDMSLGNNHTTLMGVSRKSWKQTNPNMTCDKKITQICWVVMCWSVWLVPCLSDYRRGYLEVGMHFPQPPTQAFSRGARLLSLPTSACSTISNIPFPNIVKSHCTFQILESWPGLLVYLIITWSCVWNTGKALWPSINVRLRAAKVRFSQILEYSVCSITLAKESKEKKENGNSRVTF